MNKRKRIHPKFKIHGLVLVADVKRTFSKGDITNWSYDIYEITEVNNDTIPSYGINNLPKRCNEALLKKTNLTMEENNSVLEKSNIF